MNKSIPTLSGLNIVVKDMEASIKFYRLLGLDIPEGIVWRTETGAHHVDVPMESGLGFDLDSHALAKSYNAGWNDSAPGCVIGFRVPSRDAVDDHYRDLTNAGYVGLQVPYDTFWGARYAIVQDPDGNHVGIMSPPDASKRSGLPNV
jgi:catechol 2,3-dioxygenase-like lactoylglutathione lyase family enzyme